MTKAIRIHANGGPEVLRYEDIDLPPPGPGQARVRHTAIGINYSDVNVRRGGFYLNQKPVVSADSRQRSCRRGRERRAGRDRICKPATASSTPAMHGEFYDDTGAYARGAQCVRRPAGENSGRRFRSAGGRDAC